jgi:hypothetical protein
MSPNDRDWVFLCHSSEDKRRVRVLYDHLRRDGLLPWLDEEDILPGQDWNLEIRRAIQHSRNILVCLSGRSVTKRGYVQKEIRLALEVADQQPEGTIFLIPVRLEECTVPSRLDSLQRVDLFIDNGYQRLLLALRTPLPPSQSPSNWLSASTAGAASTLEASPGTAPPDERFLSVGFDATGSAFTDRVDRPADPARQTVTFADGALTLRAVRRSGNAGVDVRATVHAPYVVTLRFAVEPGSRVMFDLGLRWAIPNKLAYLLRVNTRLSTIALVRFQDGQLTPLAPPTPVDGLATGRDVTVKVEVGDERLVLWADEGLLTQCTDTEVPETAGTVPGLDVFGNPGTGAVTIKSLDYYDYDG